MVAPLTGAKVPASWLCRQCSPASHQIRTTQQETFGMSQERKKKTCRVGKREHSGRAQARNATRHAQARPWADPLTSWSRVKHYTGSSFYFHHFFYRDQKKKPFPRTLLWKWGATQSAAVYTTAFLSRQKKNKPSQGYYSRSEAQHNQRPYIQRPRKTSYL